MVVAAAGVAAEVAMAKQVDREAPKFGRDTICKIFERGCRGEERLMFCMVQWPRASLEQARRTK